MLIFLTRTAKGTFMAELTPPRTTLKPFILTIFIHAGIFFLPLAQGNFLLSQASIFR